MAPKPSGFTSGAAGYYRDSDNAGPFYWDGSNMIPFAGNGRFGPLPAGTARNGSITTGGAAQQLAPANTARISLRGQNISAGDLWINEQGGAAVIDGAGSNKIPSGASFSISTNRAVSIIGATAGQAWTALET